MEHNYKEPKYTKISIRQRLKISNMLMTVIPMVITLLCCVACVILALIWIGRVQKLSTMSDNDIILRCQDLASRLEAAVSTEDESNLSDIEEELSSQNVHVLAEKNASVWFTYGNEKSVDSTLLKAARQIGEAGYILGINRQLVICSIPIGEDQYQFFFFIDKVSSPYHGIPGLVIAVAVVFVVVALLSFYFTNRFFFNFVFSRIMYPLECLSDGVHEIRNGNLGYQIDYNAEDEFQPVCSDFNEMSNRLQTSAEKLEHQDKNRKELLAGISHDLRSPLTSISAYTDGLLDGIAATPEAQTKYLRHIKTKASEMLHMVGRLFMFSKMDMNEYPTYPVPLQLEQEVSELIHAVQPEYEEKGLLIEVNRLENSPIVADPEQLRTVLVNIMENSLKYKTDNPGHLTVSITASEEKCVLTMSDDGPGVDEKYIDRIFDVFYRSDPARHNSGSGLGLAIAANAVYRAGGTISASNVQPHGLCIRITYPKGEQHAKNPDC